MQPAFSGPPECSVVFLGAATVQPNGNFSGVVTVPSNVAAGSTFKVSAQCTERGQAAGTEAMITLA